MFDGQLMSMLLLAAGLGLFGFVEPCTIGSSMLFIKYLEGRSPGAKIAQALIFMVTRAAFIGVLGAGIALLGSVFIQFQKAGWLLLGSVCLLIGVAFLMGKGRAISRSIGVRLSRISGNRGSLALGVVFGLNIPACAAPLIFALLGATAVGAGASAAFGFATLAVFGLFLSAPLVAALFFAPVQRGLDRVAAMSIRVPFWTGILFVALGVWSIYFGLFVDLKNWV